jgi:hypothetical protein
MYSYEDRILAVKLYIKLGKRTGATIQQLGYPMERRNGSCGGMCSIFSIEHMLAD